MIPRQFAVCAALAAAILAASTISQWQIRPADPERVQFPEAPENLRAFAQAAEQLPAIPVTITVDAATSTGPINPIWRWNGYDEPNYTYAPNGKKLIAQFAGEKTAFGPAYFRAHNLMTTGDGTARLKWGSTNMYTEDAAGKPVYQWDIVDKIFDSYLEANAKPFVQIGFMPKALSLRPEPYEHKWKPGGRGEEGNIYTGWTTPPNDYDKWRELVYQWGKHSVDKYGMKEVETWYWEVWNEPNIGYFTAAVQPGGDKQVDFQKVWDYAADGLRKAIPNAIIAGAETAGDGGAFQRAFIEHCINGTNFATGKKGSPLGMISFHAKGSPDSVRDADSQKPPHVRMGVRSQINTINTGFKIAAERPETRNLPIVIGESDPDSCAACVSANGLYPQYGYRNGALFASYTIEQLVRTMDLAEREKVNLKGSVTWAFEFEDQPFFGGFRALATNGIELPVLNTFRMLNKLGEKRLAVTSTGDVGLEAVRTAGVRGAPDIHAIAARDEKRITVISWNYHDEDIPGPAGAIDLAIAGLPADLTNVKMTEWRIDETHSNAYTAWKQMGSPEKPDPAQYKALETAAALTVFKPAADQPVAAGKANLKLILPRQALSLIELSW